jgi:WXG100 family type VII secretion target
MSQPTYTYSGGINNSVAAEMMDANTRIKAELDQMNSDLQASLRAWQTPTSKAQYEAHKARWDAAANAMPQSLQVASQTLQNITVRLNNTEKAITQSWS